MNRKILTKYFVWILGAMMFVPFSVHANWYTPSTDEGFQRPGGRMWINSGAGKQACPEDAFHDAVGPQDTPPTLDTDLYLGYYSGGGQVRAEGRTSGSFWRRSGYVICKQWDSTKPHNGLIDYPSGWTNERNIPIKISARDLGGSTRINSDVQIVIQMTSAQIGANGVIGNFSSWQNITPVQNSLNVGGRGSWGNISYADARYTYSVGRTEGTAYKFRFRLRDGAGNWISTPGIDPNGWIESPNIYLLDTEPPKANKIFMYPTKTPNPNAHKNIGDISDDPNNNFYAGEDFPLTVEYRNSDGAPIEINYTIEDDDNPRGMNIGKVDFTYKSKLREKFNKVDNDRNAGGRQISVRIGRITDKAGNFVDINKTKQFYAFANITNADVACRNGSQLVPCSGNPLAIGNSNSTNKYPAKAIADGRPNLHSQILIDKYGNIVIPAQRIGREVKRYLTTHLNKMFLNQKTRIGKSSVYFSDKNSSQKDKDLPTTAGAEKKLFDGVLQASFNGEYGFDIAVYTPTANSYDATNDPVSDLEAEFAYQYWLTISDDGRRIGTLHGRASPKEVGQMRIDGGRNPNAPSAIYAPLFTNKISGEIRDGGFIEGAEQTGNIEIQKHSSVNLELRIPPTIKVEYSGADASSFTLSGKILPAGNIITFQNNAYKNFISPFQIGDNHFITFLKQEASQISDASKIIFSTHFEYAINRRRVIYNGDIIGKKSYFGAEENNQGKQVGVKILGVANDRQLNFILNNQEENIHSVNISPVKSADVRNDIRRSVALATRNMTLDNAGTNISDAKNIPRGSGVKAGIIHHDANSSILVIEGNGGKIEFTASEISGKRTIVVKNADLYIKNDMHYDASNQNSILGVVVQKGNAGGGNLYIDIDVTNVVGTYVLDGSVFSAKNGNAVNIGKISDLKNQLYIFGSLVSYNTIGGARKNPIACPVFIQSCDANTAQKYDLNYLRRYYLFDGKPINGAKLIGGRVYDHTTGLGVQKTGLATLFADISDELAKYPVIIEYNPAIITNPPVGFEIFRD